MKIAARFFTYNSRKCWNFPIPEALAAVVIGVVPVAAFSQIASEISSSGVITPGSIRIVPRITVSETYTNNVLLSSTGRQADLVSQVSPGIHISSRGGRISGTLDYSLNELMYARNSSGRRSDNSLNASGTVEAIDKWGYIDFSGFVGRQAISAFGAPADNGISLNGNSTETSTFKLSPHVRGRFGDVADYEARYSLTSSRSKSVLASAVDSQDLSLRLSGVGGRLGWTLASEQHVSDFGAGRSTQNRRLDGQLQYSLNTQFGMYAKGSHESNNYASVADAQYNSAALGVTWTPNTETRVSVDRDSRGSYGLVADWAPSRRTNISVTRERRLFGDTHSIALAYRTSNTAWAFSDSRTVVANQGQSPVAGTGSLYDLMYSQFAARESDPAKREQYDAYLQASGVKPGATAVGGFLTSAASLQRQQQLSFSLTGQRSTLTVIGTRSQNTRLDTVSAAVDDLSGSQEVRQTGLTVNFSHRLTARSTLGFSVGRQNSSGSAGQAGSSSRTVNANLSTQLTKDTSASVSARHVVFDNRTAPYTETAVIGNLSVQF